MADEPTDLSTSAEALSAASIRAALAGRAPHVASLPARQVQTLSEWAVIAWPCSSIFSSALPWSAVMIATPFSASMTGNKRLKAKSTASTAVMVAW